MSDTQRIVGGLLSGAGEGMLESARARRHEALLTLQHQAVTDRESERERRADERSETAHRRSSGLLSSVVTGEGGELTGITRGGDTKGLGIKSTEGAGLSVEDKREMDAAIKRHTSGKGSLEGEQTDWEAVTNRLRSVGREDLARRVESMESPASSRIDVESPEYREAKSMAEEWASDQAKFFSTDKTDFGDYGGNKSEAIQAKTMELYGQLRGSPAAQGAPTNAAPRASDTATAPRGSGTQADPYRAATQADIDWFKENAPAGSVIEVEGKLYQK